MHGCGTKISKQPNGSFLAEEGEFINDDWVGQTGGCSIKEARRAAAQADTTAQMAAAFELTLPPVPNTEKSPKQALPRLHNNQPTFFPLEVPRRFVNDVVEKIKNKIQHVHNDNNNKK